MFEKLKKILRASQKFMRKSVEILMKFRRIF